MIRVPIFDIAGFYFLLQMVMHPKKELIMKMTIIYALLSVFLEYMEQRPVPVTQIKCHKI